MGPFKHVVKTFHFFFYTVYVMCSVNFPRQNCALIFNLFTVPCLLDCVPAMVSLKYLDILEDFTMWFAVTV